MSDKHDDPLAGMMPSVWRDIHTADEGTSSYDYNELNKGEPLYGIGTIRKVLVEWLQGKAMEWWQKGQDTKSVAANELADRLEREAK